MIGENYANELLAKLAGVSPHPAIHFIGRLQSNKIRRLATMVDVWESVDRVSLLDEVARRRPGATVLIQVNSTGEGARAVALWLRSRPSPPTPEVSTSTSTV